jgi:glutathione peroxidase
MRLFALLVLFLTTPMVQAKSCSELLDVDVRTLNSNESVNLCQAYQGKVLLIVNTASKCGYTDQYAELEGLYDKLNDQGLVVLGFPSNDFGGQEPGSEEQIRDFCVNTYAIKFPMFQKTRVKPPEADPLYQRLGEAAGYPRWNFHKYLIDRDGKVVDSFASAVSPYSGQILSAVQRLLRQ